MKSLLIWPFVILAGVGGTYITGLAVGYLRKVEKRNPDAGQTGPTPTTRVIGFIEVLLFFLATLHLTSVDTKTSLPEGLFFVFIGWAALKFLGYSPKTEASLGAQRRILIIGTLINAIIGTILGLFFREVI